jgi:hypothetical protein
MSLSHALAEINTYRKACQESGLWILKPAYISELFFHHFCFYKNVRKSNIPECEEIKIKNLSTQLVFITQLTKGDRPIGRAFFARGIISPGQKW